MKTKRQLEIFSGEEVEVQLRDPDYWARLTNQAVLDGWSFEEIAARHFGFGTSCDFSEDQINAATLQSLFERFLEYASNVKFLMQAIADDDPRGENFEYLLPDLND